MFSRRNLFKSLLGFLVAPKVAKEFKVYKSEVKNLPPLVGYKGKELFSTGIVYAPYIPIMTTKEISVEDFSKRGGTVQNRMEFYPATVKDIRGHV